MKKLILFLIWILLSTLSCKKTPEEEPPPKYGSVIGIVYVEVIQKPVSGLTVKLQDNGSRTTDKDGFFEFKNILEGMYILEVFNGSTLLCSKTVNVFSAPAPIYVAFTLAEDPTIPQIPQKEPMPDFKAIDLALDNIGWGYMVLGKEDDEGHYGGLLIKSENSLPTKAVYHSFNGDKNYEISFYSNGLPKSMRANNALLFFDNFNGNKFDLAVLTNSGDTAIFRDVTVEGFTWPASTKSLESRAQVIKWTGHVLRGIGCGASAIVAYGSGGLATYLAVWSCGSFLIKLADEFLDDTEIGAGLEEFTEKYDIVKLSSDCALSPASCLTDLAFKGLDAYANYIAEIDSRQEDINLLAIVLANNLPLNILVIQPGPEGKDAQASFAGFSDPCREFYGTLPDDSLINIVSDTWGPCSSEFDLMFIEFPLDVIPSGAIIANAKIELYGYGTVNHAYDSVRFTLSEVKDSWNEANVSWQNLPSTEFIGITSFTTTPEPYWRPWNVTAQISDYVKGIKDNKGFEIYATNSPTYGTFYSGDHPASAYRPRLVVSYYLNPNNR